MKEKEVPLVVTTQHRGVFFGFGRPTENKIIKLKNAQMCVYWSRDVKGVLGLASKGPTSDSKIGPPVPEITLETIRFELSKRIAKGEIAGAIK